MPGTYVKIQSVTVGSGGAADIDFQNIPAIYDDLVLLISPRSDFSAIATFWRLRFNNDSSNLYSQRSLQNDAFGTAQSGSDVNTSSANGAGLTANTATASTFSNILIYIPNYTASTAKSASADSVAETNAGLTTNLQLGFNALYWNSTAVINRITFIPGNGNLVQHSSATLYGIRKS